MDIVDFFNHDRDGPGFARNGGYFEVEQAFYVMATL
jgi:hypothetical protein